jgi:hypothetical protein
VLRRKNSCLKSNIDDNSIVFPIWFFVGFRIASGVTVFAKTTNGEAITINLITRQSCNVPMCGGKLEYLE